MMCSSRYCFVVLAAIVSTVGPVSAQTAAQPQRATSAPKPKPVAAANPASAQPVAAAATTGAASKGGGDIIAKVGNSDLSADDLKAYVGALGPREQAALAKDPAMLSQTVRLLLANRLVLQELTEKKWDQQPAIAAQLERVRESAMVEMYLRSVSTPPASYPSDDEIQKVYDANRASMMLPRQFALEQIFVAAPKDADKAAEDKARKALEEAQARLKAPNADFLAIAGSESGSGDLGWVAENQIRPEIRTQVLGLAKGAIAEPIRLDDGWHILRLKDTKPAYLRTLPEVREQLVEQMRTERANALRQAYLAEVMRQRPAVINELALSNLLNRPAE
jgi:parvulin-like peptidyl-prolyl isomerase